MLPIQSRPISHRPRFGGVYVQNMIYDQPTQEQFKSFLAQRVEAEPAKPGGPKTKKALAVLSLDGGWLPAFVVYNWKGLLDGKPAERAVIYTTNPQADHIFRYGLATGNTDPDPSKGNLLGDPSITPVQNPIGGKAEFLAEVSKLPLTENKHLVTDRIVLKPHELALFTELQTTELPGYTPPVLKPEITKKLIETFFAFLPD